MRTSRTRGTLLTRLERLETRTAEASRKITIQFGDLRQLPADYKGERHTIIAKHLPSRNGQEWVEFEEVAGPDPNPHKPQPGSVPTHIDVMFV